MKWSRTISDKGGWPQCLHYHNRKYTYIWWPLPKCGMYVFFLFIFLFFLNVKFRLSIWFKWKFHQSSEGVLYTVLLWVWFGLLSFWYTGIVLLKNVLTKWMPFHMCKMIFAINGYTKEYMTLVKDYLGVEYTGENWSVYILLILFPGKKQLLEYEIQMWDLFVINSSIASEAEIRIVFRRSFIFQKKSYIYMS